MSDNSLERQIQKMMEGLEFKPDAAVWTKVQAELAPAKKRRIFGWYFPLFLLLLAGAGVGGWMLSHNNSTTSLAGQKEYFSSDNNINKADTGISLEQATQLNKTNTQSETYTNGENQPQNKIQQKQSLVPAGKTAPQSATTQSIKSSSSADVDGTLIVKTQAAGNVKTPAATPKYTAAAQQQWAADGYGNRRNNQLQENTSANAISELYNRPMLPYQAQTDIVHSSYPPLPVTAATLKLTGNQQRQLYQPIVNKPAVIASETNSKWRFMPFISGGIAKISGDNDGGISTYEKTYYDNLNSSIAPTGAPVAVRAVVYYKTKSQTGKAFSAGILAEHPLLSRLSFQTGLRYQYINYNTITVTSTDSIGRQGNGFASISASNISGNNSYRMHYLGVPILLHYNFSNPVGLTAGVINDVMVGANKDGTSLQGAMKTWVPNAYFAFVVNIPGSDKLQWKIMPYIQYGLKPMSKEGNQRLLQPGLQVSLKLNNK